MKLSVAHATVFDPEVAAMIPQIVVTTDIGALDREGDPYLVRWGVAHVNGLGTGYGWSAENSPGALLAVDLLKLVGEIGPSARTRRARETGNHGKANHGHGGFPVSVVPGKFDLYPPGHVIGQQPSAGMEVLSGSRVTLTVVPLPQ
jgi:hypothetical protein